MRLRKRRAGGGTVAVKGDEMLTLAALWLLTSVLVALLMGRFMHVGRGQ